jgi:hypothetical protein
MRIPGMKTTGHTDRGYGFHHRFIVADLKNPETFTHITIEIDLNSHGPPPL